MSPLVEKLSVLMTVNSPGCLNRSYFSHGSRIRGFPERFNRGFSKQERGSCASSPVPARGTPHAQRCSAGGEQDPHQKGYFSLSSSFGAAEELAVTEATRPGSSLPQHTTNRSARGPWEAAAVQKRPHPGCAATTGRDWGHRESPPQTLWDGVRRERETTRRIPKPLRGNTALRGPFDPSTGQAAQADTEQPSPARCPRAIGRAKFVPTDRAQVLLQAKSEQSKPAPPPVPPIPAALHHPTERNPYFFGN